MEKKKRAHSHRNLDLERDQTKPDKTAASNRYLGKTERRLHFPKFRSRFDIFGLKLLAVSTVDIQ